MNSKARVKAALRHEAPDRIPFGEFAIDFDTAERILGHETYLRAKAKSQIALWEGRRDEVVQSWKEDGVDLFKKLDFLDIICVNSIAFGIVPPADYEPDPPKRVDDNTWEDREGRILKLSDATKDITVVHDPKMWEREYKREDFDKEAEVTPPDPSIFEVIDHVIAAFKNDRYLLGGSGHNVGLVMLGEMERAMVELLTNPGLIKAASDLYATTWRAICRER